MNRPPQRFKRSAKTQLRENAAEKWGADGAGKATWWKCNNDGKHFLAGAEVE